MRAGELKRRITLQTVTHAAGPTGERTPTWSDVVTVWGRVQPVAAGEPWAGQQQAQPNVTHKVTVRVGGHVTRASVHPKYRWKYGTRILEMTGVLETEEDGRQLVIGCTEKV